MKILHLSDTHGCHHRLYNLPEADILVHSGDFTMAGSENEALDFRNQSVIFVLSNGLDGMGTPDIESSTREERLEFVRNEFRCLGNCPICGKCSFLRGREAEDLYADYIEGRRSFRDITAEHRNINIK